MRRINHASEIDEIINKEFVIIVAKSKSCSVCVSIADQLEQLVSEYKNIPLYSIYIDEIEEFRGQFLVFTVPTVLIFSRGKELVRESRFINISNIKRQIDIYSQ